MSDLSVSNNTVQRADKVFCDWRPFSSRRGFILTNWITNCHESFSAVPAKRRAMSTEELDHEHKMQKVHEVERIVMLNLSTD